MPSFGLSQQQRQQQTLTPQQHQGLDLLQTNTMELAPYIRREADCNPAISLGLTIVDRLQFDWNSDLLFRGELMERVKEKQEGPKARWTRVMRPYLGMAGVFVFAMLMLHWVLPNAFPSVERPAEDPVEAYWNSLVEEQGIEFDDDFNPTEEEIIEYLTQEMDASDFYWIAGKF